MAAEKKIFFQESNSVQHAGKGEHIPGDGRRLMVDGVIYRVRAFDTFIREHEGCRLRKYEDKPIDYLEKIQEIMEEDPGTK